MSDSVSLTSNTASNGAFTFFGLIAFDLLWDWGFGPRAAGSVDPAWHAVNRRACPTHSRVHRVPVRGPI